jgi:hypothetical protein
MLRWRLAKGLNSGTMLGGLPFRLDLGENDSTKSPNNLETRKCRPRRDVNFVNTLRSSPGPHFPSPLHWPCVAEFTPCFVVSCIAFFVRHQTWNPARSRQQLRINGHLGGCATTGCTALWSLVSDLPGLDPSSNFHCWLFQLEDSNCLLAGKGGTSGFPGWLRTLWRLSLPSSPGGGGERGGSEVSGSWCARLPGHLGEILAALPLNSWCKEAPDNATSRGISAGHREPTCPCPVVPGKGCLCRREFPSSSSKGLPRPAS